MQKLWYITRVANFQEIKTIGSYFDLMKLDFQVHPKELALLVPLSMQEFSRTSLRMSPNQTAVTSAINSRKLLETLK